MQDAYFVDQNAKGNWTQIGFKAPASKNFTYTDGDFNATASFDVSDCTTDTWTVTVTPNSANHTIAYQASDNCPALTPNFKNIGTSGAGS